MNHDVFEGSLEICERHAERLRWAMGTLEHRFPLSPSTLSELTPLDLAVVDQFIVRFSKLQDAMGTKLLPGVLELTQEQGELLTFIDKLNRLEKIGAIASASDWLRLREMRNQFSHDYPDDPEIQASLLNKAFTLAGDLLETLEHVKTFASPYRRFQNG
ncbi:hypothetical protein [Halomonas sp. LBP4]|uniref:hypothetical protein n=1 Tax=Halomonas sp. LBP4 TaxID=2044917 RepID=UPI000D75BCC5|nr:hypothetical protein [Halomonas sp. LBP4]PXX95628.1 hypothetical protein CR157_18405 [Halomonas sp. LBP4]